MKKNHYVGVLTLEPTKKIYYDKWIEDTWIIEYKSYEPFYIVDGQQRITTAIILIVAMLKVMKERNIDSLNFTSYDEICRKYIYESKDGNINQTYIFGYENDNPSYAYLIKEIYEQKIIQENDNANTIFIAWNAKRFISIHCRTVTNKANKVYSNIRTCKVPISNIINISWCEYCSG